MAKAKEREGLRRFIPRDFLFAERRALIAKMAEDGNAGGIPDLITKDSLAESCVDMESEDGGRDALEKAQVKLVEIAVMGFLDKGMASSAENKFASLGAML
eukprot:11496680-Alexandrium_andersonii.AAC.1